MSYRSKRTFGAMGCDASVSQEKQCNTANLATSQVSKPSSNPTSSLAPKPASLATTQTPKPTSLASSQAPKPSCLATSHASKPSSLATSHASKPLTIPSSQSPKPPLETSSNKWGPFGPPKQQASQTFGYISEPIKSSLAAKNITTFTVSPSMHASESSMHQKIQPKKSNLSQPLSDTTKQRTRPNLGEGRQKNNMMQGKSGTSQVQQKSMSSQQLPPLSTTQKDILLQQQQRTPSVMLQQKEVEQPQKEMQKPPHSHMQQPISSLSTRMKSPFPKRVAAAPTGAKRHVMSLTSPSISENVTFEQNLSRKHVNNESISEIRSKVPQQMERSPEPYHAESYPRENHSSEYLSSESVDLNEDGNRGTSAKKAIASRPRRRTVVPNWPENVKFDEKEEVIAFDTKGKRHLVKGPVQARDIWTDGELRYYVEFNDLNQPLGKGGSILVSFLGDVAKREAFCPVGLTDWHKMKKKMKVDIVTVVRDHFVIPSGELFNNAILHRTSKYWKNYRFFLRSSYFNPKRTKDENYENRPDGVSTQNWIDLVDYWFSPTFKLATTYGAEKRISLIGCF